MYQNTCGAAAASAGVCVETDKDYHSLISKEPQVPAIENDYSGFDVVKATQVNYLLKCTQANKCFKRLWNTTKNMQSVIYQYLRIQINTLITFNY